MMNNKLKLYFKPTVQSAGARFFQKGAVSFSQPSDTEIVAYIKASSGYKVSLKSKSVSSDLIQATCACSAAKKNQFCQHIWATLLAISEKSSDFLENKTQIEFAVTKADVKNDFKEKQATFRKQQYQKQKQRLKEQKQARKNISKVSEFPSDVEVALQFFLQNGFPLRDSLNQESIRFAKVKLARVFHPDLGGSHQEILELNRCAEILQRFSRTK